VIIKKILFILTLVFVVFGSANATGPQPATMPIIEGANPTTSLTYEDLRAIFTLVVSRWADGSRIVVVILSSDNELQRQFLFEYFGLTPARYNEIVESRVSSGRAKPPVIVNTESEMIRKVSGTVGSVGFTSRDIYIGAKDGVKVVPIF